MINRFAALHVNLRAEEGIDDANRRALVLDAIRQTESTPSLLGVSGHLLTAATKSAA